MYGLGSPTPLQLAPVFELVNKLGTIFSGFTPASSPIGALLGTLLGTLANASGPFRAALPPDKPRKSPQ